MTYFLKVIQVDLSEHRGHNVDAQGFLATIDIFLLKLILHFLEKWDVLMLLGVVSLSFELLNLRLIQLSLDHEEGLIVLKVEIVVYL